MKNIQAIEHMCSLPQPESFGPADLPVEGGWVQVKQVDQLSGLTSGCGTCAANQGCCKLTLNVKDGVIKEALIETAGCSGATHGAAIAAEVLPEKTILEAMTTHLACDAISSALRELFLNLTLGRTQTAFSEGGLPVGSTLDDLAKGKIGQHGTSFSSSMTGPRYFETAEGYVLRMALDDNDQPIGYQYVNIGEMISLISNGYSPDDAFSEASHDYGRCTEASRFIDPRRE